MYRWIVALGVLLGASGVHAVPCELPDSLKVQGTVKQKQQVCEAFEGAKAFFERYGYTIEPNKVVGNISFAPKVLIPTTDSKGNATFSGGVRVLGMFDRGSGELKITDEREPWVKHKKRTYFKLQYTPALYRSVLLHEIVHLMSKQLYQYKDYPHAQEEYIAYAAQIESLSAQERERVVGACALPACAFADEMNINDIVHFSNPHEFGVMSWRHFSSPQGGRKMLERIYSGAFKPVDFAQMPN